MKISKKRDKITIKAIWQIAQRYRVGITKRECQIIACRLPGLIEQVETLDELDEKLIGIKPLNHVCGSKNVFRNDKIIKGLSQKEALSTVKEKHKGFVKIRSIF